MEVLFKSKPIKINTLGEYLASIRNRLNFDIKTVSMLSQIKESYVLDLEAGNYDKLPADVYVKGFLKNLAAVYHIKEEVLIEQYEKEHGFEPKQTNDNKTVSLLSTINLNPKVLILGITVFFGLLAVIYVGSQVRSVMAPPLLELTEPFSDTTVSGGSIILTGRAEVGSDVFINNQAVLTDKNGQFNENLILSPGINVIEVVAKNKFGKVSTITRRINAEVVTAVLPETLPVVVTIEVGPESTWIYLEADGVVVQRGTMLPGSSKTVSAKQDILLTSANAGSTKVVYNGKDLGKLGRNGEVVRNVEFSVAE